MRLLRGRVLLPSALVLVLIVNISQPFVKSIRLQPSAVARPGRRVGGVDPFVGTSGDGHTTPGAHAPFGMVFLVPLNAAPAAAD